MRHKDYLVVLIGLLPPSRFKNFLLRILGFSIAANSKIGCVLFLRIGELHLGPNSNIGHFNVFRDLTKLQIGESLVVGQWNWVSSARPLHVNPENGKLEIGVHSAVTSRHYLDCSGGIYIGNFTTVAGVRSTFITHGIDWSKNTQTTKPIKIGDFCLISSNVNLAPGCEIGNRTVIAMGSTVSHQVPSGELWISPRANFAKVVDGKYFKRISGYVGLESKE